MAGSDGHRLGKEFPPGHLGIILSPSIERKATLVGVLAIHMRA